MEGYLALLIPILVPLGTFAMIFGLVYLQKKENLAMIDKGINPRDNSASGPKPFKYLKWGLLLVGAGLGTLLARILDSVLHSGSNGNPDGVLYFSLIAVGGGIGLFISYRMEMKELRKQRDESSSPAKPFEQ